MKPFFIQGQVAKSLQSKLISRHLTLFKKEIEAVDLFLLRRRAYYIFFILKDFSDSDAFSTFFVFARAQRRRVYLSTNIVLETLCLQRKNMPTMQSQNKPNACLAFGKCKLALPSNSKRSYTGKRGGEKNSIL